MASSTVDLIYKAIDFLCWSK